MALYNVETGRKSILHRVADCHDCEWCLQDYRDNRMADKARQHVAQTGHTVGYETGTSTLYTKGSIAG